MNIQYLHYAAEVAKTGSISQAAANLHMGQPNLSKYIRELEASLGVQLFYRTRRGVEPTPEGEEFLVHARAILSQVEQVESLYQPTATSPVRFHLAATPSLYISEAFARFCDTVIRECSPRQLHLGLREMSRAEVIDAVENGASDAGVVRCRSDEETALVNYLVRKNLDGAPLNSYHLCVALHAQHPLARHKTLSQQMLAPYPRIILDMGVAESMALFESELKSPENENIRISVFSRDSAISILQAVPNACMPCAPLPPALASRHQLSLRPITGAACRYRDFYITRRGSLQRHASQLLINELHTLQSGCTSSAE